MPLVHPPDVSPRMRQLVDQLERSAVAATRVHAWDGGDDRQDDARATLLAEIALLEAQCARLRIYARTMIDTDRQEWQGDKDVLSANRLLRTDLDQAHPEATPETGLLHWLPKLRGRHAGRSRR
ncbi:MAG TPA: hypothetical protein VGT61_12030 [Thermomicrobiales bacterium]|nr:hypothetical protein [Thermomicrobiales bacterium]